MPKTALTHLPVWRIRSLQLTTLIALFAGWELLAHSGLLYEGVIPSTGKIVLALWEEINSLTFYGHLGVTLLEISVGFIIATFAGVVCGVALGSRCVVAQVADPYLSSLATAPKIIFLPIVMLMFGIGPESKMAIGALSGFFPIALSTMAGTLTVRPVLVNVGRAFNLSPRQMLTKIYMPSLVGPIIRGMRLGLGVTVIGVLLGEIKLANIGLGFLAIEHYNNFRIEQMYAILIVIFLLAILFNRAMTAISNRYEQN